MAIDFGRMARGIATGYLSAKIANTEANDRLKEDIIKQAGDNFYNNTLPEFQKREKNRENTYNQVSKIHGNDIAEYFDQGGFITGQANDFEVINDMLSDNNNINKTKLKAYLEGVEGGSYASRKEKRFSSMADQEKFVMGNLSKNGFGANTLMSQLGRDTTEEQAMAPTETQAVAPVPTEEDTTTTKLPSFEEIFGDSTDSESVFLSMKPEDQVRLQKLSNDQFKADTLNEVSGMRRLQESYKERYNNLPEAEQKRKTLNQFARERYFEEEFLPQYGLSYSGAQTAEPSFVTAARYTIGILKANDPNDPSIEEIKNDLRQRLGTNNLSEYGL
jgi:hypothetical protein